MQPAGQRRRRFCASPQVGCKRAIAVFFAVNRPERDFAATLYLSNIPVTHVAEIAQDTV
jgi:hypothetical protein